MVEIYLGKVVCTTRGTLFLGLVRNSGDNDLILYVEEGNLHIFCEVNILFMGHTDHHKEHHPLGSLPIVYMLCSRWTMIMLLVLPMNEYLHLISCKLFCNQTLPFGAFICLSLLKRVMTLISPLR